MHSGNTLAIGDLRLSGRDLSVRFPATRSEIAQDVEWCEVQIDGSWRRIRFHDYSKIYQVHGLYESIFYRALKCKSPARVVGLLRDVLAEAEAEPQSLRVLDVGAGNGMVGAELRALDMEAVYGIDIIPEARRAALRDRPWVYDDYFIVDLCDLPEEVEKRLRRTRLNCLTVVAALGFGDIPAAAFLGAIDLIDSPGWLAFNIKEDFIRNRDDSGFATLLQQLIDEDVIRLQAYRRYRHRLAVNGRPLHYVAMVATKHRDLPDHFSEYASSSGGGDEQD